MKTLYDFPISLLKIGANAFRKKHLTMSFMYVVVILFVGLGAIMFLDLLPFSRSAYSQANTKSSKSNSTNQGNFFTLKPTEIPLLKPLSEYQIRINALEERTRKLDEREESLRLLEKDISEKLDSLQMIRKEIMGLLQEKDDFDARRYEHLVRVYEGMKPAEAAALIEHLHQDTAIQLLSRMKSKKVSQILEAVKPADAAKLSELLASIPPQAVHRNNP